MSIRIIGLIFFFLSNVKGSNLNEKSPLVNSFPQEHHKTLLEFIKRQDSNHIEQFLSDHPTSLIPADLITVAQKQYRKRDAHCCRNGFPLVTAGSSTALSICLLLSSSCRPLANHFFSDFFLWGITAGSFAAFVYSTVKLKKDWQKNLSCDAIILMLNQHNTNHITRLEYE